MRPTWAEIDVRAFERNVEAIRARLPEGARLAAVVKANAYGHGAVELAKRCRPESVAMLVTALLEEALELRAAGITLPLLVLGALTDWQVRTATEEQILVGIPGPEALTNAARVAREREVRVHLKLDSGMGRMGITEGELADVIELLRSTPGLRVEGIYTHFASAGDPRDPLTEQQLARFEAMLATLREAGIDAPIQHTSNSAATMRGLVRPGDVARVGLSLYGAEPLDVGTSVLEPVMRWRTAIVRLKDLPAGHSVGYGATFHTTRPSRIATLPVGYADGYNRLFSNRGEVLVRGKRVPVVGRVSMDLVTIDVTDVEAEVGHEVVLLGDGITVEELATKLDTISWEVLCGVSARVPRVYVDGDEVFAVHSRFDR
ncbi:MAG TPA: alanine racemase [Thermoanaerobaculia bacterium]|jgi:alanine racemase